VVVIQLVYVIVGIVYGLQVKGGMWVTATVRALPLEGPVVSVKVVISTSQLTIQMDAQNVGVISLGVSLWSVTKSLVFAVASLMSLVISVTAADLDSTTFLPPDVSPVCVWVERLQASVTQSVVSVRAVLVLEG
jgi:hypothetical protein